MSATEMVAPVVRRLDTVIDALPKEGYKAAVAIGVVDSIRTLVENLADLASKIECVANAKGGCKGNGQSYCNPACAGLFYQKINNTIIINKYGSNAFSAVLSPEKVEIGIKGIRVIVEGSTVKVGIEGKEGYVWETVNLSDVGDVYTKNYTIKYASRRIGKPVRVSLSAIQACAILNAIVC